MNNLQNNSRVAAPQEARPLIYRLYRVSRIHGIRELGRSSGLADSRHIASYAQTKQLDAALAAYATIQREGRQPTKYTYAALINAHVNSGDALGRGGLGSASSVTHGPLDGWRHVRLDGRLTPHPCPLNAARFSQRLPTTSACASGGRFDMRATPDPGGPCEATEQSCGQ